MTVTQHGDPGAPYGSAHGTAPGVPPAPPPGPQGYDWGYPPPPVRRTGEWMAVGMAATALLALAALVVGIVALVTRPAPSDAAVAPTNQPGTTTPADFAEANRALCTEIAPLMAENDRFSNGYVDLGEPGTPARDAATPKYISDTLDWISRVQPIVDQHPDVDPYLRRSLQRFIDDQRLFVVDLRPGPLPSHARALYTDSIGAYSGPLHLCHDLGIKW